MGTIIASRCFQIFVIFLSDLETNSPDLSAYANYILLDILSSVKTNCLDGIHNVCMDKKFCQNLKAARVQAGMTQKQIASLLGVVDSCYANWEQGRTEPGIASLRKLCSFLGVTADELLNGEL